MKCILCLEDKTLNDEHVIPDNLGGALVIQVLCKDHNSFLGSNVDEVFSASFMNQLACLALGIESRRKKIPQPFKIGETADGQNATFDHKIKPTLVTKLIEKKVSDEETHIEIALDSSNKDDIEKILRKRVRKILLARDPNVSEEKIEADVQKLVNQIPKELPTQEYNESYKFEKTIDFKDYFLEYMKIAYEIASIEFGMDYVERSTVASELRSALLDLNKFPNIALEVPFEKLPINLFFDSQEKHYILLLENFCYIQIFGIPGIVQISGENEEFSLDSEFWKYYEFCVTDKTFFKKEFVNVEGNDSFDKDEIAKVLKSLVK
jgi:hypothetical protein